MKHPLPFLLSVLVFLAACSGNGSGSSLKVVTDKINKTEATYTLDLEIPQVKGLSDEATQKDINDRLQKIAADLQDGFKKDIAGVVIDKDSTKSGLNVDYSVVTLSEKLISLDIEASPYISGAAHPNHFAMPFTYDIEAKKPVTLTDIFNTKEKYLERLSELSIAQLIAESKKKGTYYEAKVDMIRQGAAPTAEDFRSFTIANGTIIFIFDPYQVGPYAEGTQTITLSRAQITDVLSNYGRKILSETEIKK